MLHSHSQYIQVHVDESSQNIPRVGTEAVPGYQIIFYRPKYFLDPGNEREGGNSSAGEPVLKHPFVD